MAQQANPNRPSATIEDVKLLYRNFRGAKQIFNEEGNRNFCVILPEDIALQMQKDGWNVKKKDPREEGDDYLYFIKVNVRFQSQFPPKIVMVTSRGNNLLSEREVALLDATVVVKADLKITGWRRTPGDSFSAFLEKIYVTIEEDELDMKYGQSTPPADNSDWGDV